MSKKTKILLIGAAVLVLIVVAALGAVGSYAWNLLHRPFKGYASDELVLEIERGSDARSILERLADEGVIADATLARLYLVYGLDDPALQAGEYRFEGLQTTPQVLTQLIEGRIVRHWVTVVEGLTIFETAEVLAEAGFGDYDAFAGAVQQFDLVRDLDPEAADLEGYLFPDTYGFAKGTSESEIIAAMVENFRRQYAGDVAPLLAEGDDRDVREVVVLASIVEKEARLDDERDIIAGVYTNRLERGMGLYADPTIIYALKRLGRWDGNIRRPDLKLDSPYNTYLYPGLPPGPIASPGMASLQAAARPADVSYLYFVSRNDGSHVFADTLAEHNRNVNEWQRRYWRRRAQEKAAEGN